MNFMNRFSIQRTLRAGHLLMAVAILCAVLHSAGFAQIGEKKQLTFGVVAGYALNQHSANFSELAGFPIYSPRIGAANEPANFTGTGSQGGLAVSAFAQYQLSPQIAVQLRVGYADRSGKATTTENYTIGLLSPPTGSGNTRTSVDASSLYTITGNFSTLNIEPTIVFTPMDNIPLKVMAGFGVNLLMSKTFDQNEQLILPANVIAGFTDGRGSSLYPTTRNVQAGTALPNASGLVPTVQVGVGYEIALARFALTPEVMYSLMLGNFASDISWKASGIRFGVGVRML